MIGFLFYWHLWQNEVARAIELREIVTTLGPAYIKLGQALSIRPDILSPAAMTELQKLCDKVILKFKQHLSVYRDMNREMLCTNIFAVIFGQWRLS